MGKKGEKLRSLLIHAAFVIAVIAGLYLIISSRAGITGHAVLDPGTASAKLESALSSSSALSAVREGSICVVINDPEQPLSLQAEKTGTGWSVTETTGYCSGLNSEDVVVQFPDYDSFSEIADNPSPRNIANGAIDRDFEILESRYVEKGGNVLCNPEFKAKYCDALKSMTTEDLLIEGDMSCCIEDLSRSQRKKLEEHLQDDRFRDESGALQQPGGGVSDILSPVFLIIIAVVLAGGVGAALLLKGRRKTGAQATGAHGAGTPGGPGAGQGMPGTATPGAGAAGTGAQATGAQATGSYGAGTPGAGLQAGGIPSSPSTPSAAARPTPSKQLSDLQNYVDNAMMQGYDKEDIRTHLLEIGWDQATAESVVEKAVKKLAQR